MIGALENSIEGKSRWMLYDFNNGDGGYVDIRRFENEDAPAGTYKVEYVRWSEPSPIGYRSVVFDVRLLRKWMWKLIDDDQLPDPMDEYRQFDVNCYFQKIADKVTTQIRNER